MRVSSADKYAAPRGTQRHGSVGRPKSFLEISAGSGTSEGGVQALRSPCHWGRWRGRERPPQSERWLGVLRTNPLQKEVQNLSAGIAQIKYLARAGCIARQSNGGAVRRMLSSVDTPHLRKRRLQRPQQPRQQREPQPSSALRACRREWPQRVCQGRAVSSVIPFLRIGDSCGVA